MPLVKLWKNCSRTSTIILHKQALCNIETHHDIDEIINPPTIDMTIDNNTDSDTKEICDDRILPPFLQEEIKEDKRRGTKNYQLVLK